MKSSRRNFLKNISVLTSIPTLGLSNDISEVTSISGNNSTLSLPQLGKIQINSPKDINKSPFGIGCETLDRDLWDTKEIYPWMNNLSVKWARLQTGWARVEREKGIYDWHWLDESVDGLIERGFTPFFNVGYGNPNYNESKGGVGYHPLVNDETFTAWKKFVKELAIRYRNKIQFYEIWNEPNLRGFWSPGETDPEKYVNLVRHTAPIIRENCPGAVIIGGVLSRLPFTFIRSLFENGLGKEIDIFSFHPYGTVPENYNDRIKALRKFIDQYDPSIKLWQGENGFPSQPNSTGFAGEPPWTENIQAKIMLRRLITDCSLGLDMSLWFLIVDLHDYPKGSGKVNYKGILRVKPHVEPKVCFYALQNLGSAIYGDVSVRNAIVHCTESNDMTIEEKYKVFGAGNGETIEKSYTTMLNTGGGKILAYWKTVKATDNYKVENTDLILWDWEGNGFDEPVLVDLLSGNIYDLKNNCTKYYDEDKWRISHEAQFFQKLPLTDYPYLIMEKELIVG
ncbi:MAG: hypothetical protein JJU28_00855 [Cyclobacteriaceae bacterium]|nr:hypothetical protein [Cyclobacteriaceae bacterium]